MADPLVPYALQHVITGMVLYTIRAFPASIPNANHNLQVSGNLHRFVRVEETSQPLPS